MTEELKKCHKCLQEKPMTMFFRMAKSPDGREPRCKACEKERKSAPEAAVKIKKYWADRYQNTRANPEQAERSRASMRKYARKWRAENRGAIFAMYGSKCNACGESDPIVLDIDHVQNDGASHRAEMGQGQKLIKDILGLGYCPERFQLLCKNCNWRKEHARRMAERYE